MATVRTEDGSVMPTQMLLCEHAEKLEAAKVLYELHLEWVDLVYYDKLLLIV